MRQGEEITPTQAFGEWGEAESGATCALSGLYEAAKAEGLL